MAGVACFRLAHLLQAELVAQVALLALADRAICPGLTDVVARLAGKAGNGRPLDVIERVAHLVRPDSGLGDGLVHGLERAA
jgi:hypothetical protein